jgi:hypothetical protein
MSATTTRPADDPRTPYGPAPPRSIEQRLAALERANDVRLRRAQLKRDMKAGRKHASQIIAEPPEWAETMRIVDLLLAVPRWGRTTVGGALKCVEVAPGKHLGGLSPRQRRELLRWLHGR